MKKTYSWNVEHRCYSTACHKTPEQHISKNRHTLIIDFFEFTTTHEKPTESAVTPIQGFYFQSQCRAYKQHKKPRHSTLTTNFMLKTKLKVQT